MSYSRSSLRNQKAKLAADYNNLLKELSSHEMTSVGCYTIGETIGEGTYGKVKLGTHQLTGKQVAIKKISKQHASIIAREIHHHRQLDHPNIVKIYEIISTESAIHIISEHCPNGELFDLLADTGRFSEYRAQRWFHQLVNAMKECHRQGIVHRDLKLENILLDINDNCKICDFGFARYADNKQLLETFCGSLAYSAPEVIMRQKYTGPETDIWSLGVILYTLIAGELPFDDDSEIMMQRKIVNVDYELPTYFSPQVQDLISNILKHDPNERLTIDQILNHPWMLAIFDDEEKDEQHIDEEEEEEIGMDYDDDSSSSTRNSSRSDIDSIFSSPRFKNDEDDDDLITELSSHDSYIHLLDNSNNNNGKSGDLMHLQQHYRRSGGATSNYNDNSKFSPQVRYSLGMMRPEEKARYTSSRPPRFSAPTVSNNKSTPTTSPLPCRSSLPLSLPAHRESIRPSSTSSTSSLDIPMSPVEQKVSNALLSAGFDEYMVQSMRSNACNSTANTLWNMLMEKQQMDISNHSMIMIPDSPLSADNSKILHANERWSSLINSPNRLSSQNTSSSIPTDSSCQTTLTYPPSLSSVTMDQMKQTTSLLSSATEMKSTSSSVATMTHKPIEIDTSSQISYSSLNSKPSYSSLTNATSLTAKSSIRSISSTASSNTTSSHDNKAGWFTSVKTWFGGNSAKQDISTRRPVSYRDFDVYQTPLPSPSPSTFTNANTNSASEYNQGQLTPPIYRSGTLKYRRHMLPSNEINVYEKQQQNENPSYHSNNIKRMDPLVSPPPPTATMYSRPVADGLSIITTPKYVSSTAVPSHVQEVDICEERNPLYHQPLPPPAPPAPSYTNNSKNSNNRQCYQNPCLPKLPIQQQQKQKPVPQQQPSPPPSPPDSKPMIKEIPSIPSSTSNSNNNKVFLSSPAPSPIPTTKKIAAKDSTLLLTPPSTNPIKLDGLLLSTTKEDNDIMHNNNINNYNINTVPTPTISTTSTLVEKENDNNNNNNNNEKVSPSSVTKEVSPIPSLSSKSIQQSSPLLTSIKPLSSRSSPPALLASNGNSSNNTMKSSPIPSSNRRFEFAPRSRLSVYGMNDRGLMANKAIIEEEEEEE